MRPGNEIAIDFVKLRLRLFRGELLVPARFLKDTSARRDAAKSAARRDGFDIGVSNFSAASNSCARTASMN